MLSYYSYTNKGGCEVNEDSPIAQSDGNNGVFIVADGLGGHRNGEVASRIVADAIASELNASGKHSAEGISEAYKKANDLLILAQAEKGMMKTTAVTLDIADGKAEWGYVGDSRLYYFSDNEIAAVTKDHSVTYKKYVSGEITRRQMNTDDDRSSLLRVMGTAEKSIPDFSPAPTPLKKGDAFLLCSDGFWEYVYDEEMLIDFLKSASPRQWIDLMLLRHIKRTRQGNDNFTALAVFID